MKTKEQTAEKYSKIKNIFTYSHIAAVVKTHKKKTKQCNVICKTEL